MTEQSKMPARIWAWPKPGHASKKPDGGWESWKDYDDAIPYVRADIVEPLVEALRGMLSWAEARPDKHPLDTWNAGRDALQAYEAAILRARQTEGRG